MVGVESAALSASRMSNERSAGELHPRKLRPWPVSSTGSHSALSENCNDRLKGLSRSIYFAFRGKIHSVNFGDFFTQ